MKGARPPGDDHVCTGLRERKKQQTRAALHRAAVDLVAEHGLAAVTVEQIAEAADVSPRTFFNHFPSKESAVVGIDADEASRVAAELRARPDEESPTEAVRAVLLAHVGRITGDQALWRRRRRLVFSDPTLLHAGAAMSGAIERELVAALHERLHSNPRTDLRAPVLVAATWATIRAGLANSLQRRVAPGVAVAEALRLLDERAGDR